MTFTISGSTTTAEEALTPAFRKRVESDLVDWGGGGKGAAEGRRWRHAGERVTTRCRTLMDVLEHDVHRVDNRSALYQVGQHSKKPKRVAHNRSCHLATILRRSTIFRSMSKEASCSFWSRSISCAWVRQQAGAHTAATAACCCL